MKNKRYFLPVLLLLFATFASCDKIDEPYIKPGGGGGVVPPGEAVRKVLLEEYTGHRCPNCPNGAAIAKQIQEIFGEQAIVMAVHAGMFSNPGSSPYTTDYRTAAGSAWDSYFEVGNQGYPSGIINRQRFDGKIVLGRDSWTEIVAGLVTVEADASITISPTYNGTTRKLELDINTEFLNVLEGEFWLQVCLLESGMISAQLNQSTIIEDYVHNHVLRQDINGIWGETLASNVVVGEKYSKLYEITLDEKYVAENCAVVAFVYNSETKEIVQAEEVHIIE
ncbi:MAG: Omp28 family outer membrane lipoprotein [Lentimicrobiaceae bacterium]|jgi:hypothetical protein|nr:Omp28 family outer membrane lipoprotein [Lentimicrobiaceae bacterium]